MRKTSEKYRQRIAAAIKALLHMFENKEFPATVATSIIHKQAGDDIPSDHWTLANRMLVYLFTGTIDCRGILQWKQVGRKVKKGCRATYIWAPSIKKIKQEETDPITGVKVEQEQSILVGFCTVPVFAVTDTEGAPLPTFDYAPKTRPVFWNVSERLGISVTYSALRADYYGQFNRSNNSIELCSESPQVYLHELSHAVHATIKDLSKLPKDYKEIVAEFSSLVLCHLANISGYEDKSFRYICSYIKDKSDAAVLKSIMSVLSDVEKIVETVLSVADQEEATAEVTDPTDSEEEVRGPISLF